MSFLNRQFNSCYEELIRYYPRYYRDVREMVAILKAHGSVCDTLEDNVERVYNNNFFDTMDETAIASLEKFLGIALNKSRTLEERRRMVKACFAGFGTVSASVIQGMIHAYTGAEVKSTFEPFDDEGNNMLTIIIARGNEETIYMSDILLLLSKKLPAHIEYRAIMDYRYAVVVGKKRTHYKYAYDLCGTKPETILIAQIEGVTVVTEANPNAAVMNYKQSTEGGIEPEAGLYPQTTTLAHNDVIDAVTAPSNTNAVMTYKHSAESGADSETGAYPQTATLAHNDAIDSATEAAATACGVDYIPCGTQYSGTGG